MLPQYFPSLFQFTPLCERLQSHLLILAYIQKFQFTPLYERLHADRENFMCMEDISIHASLREATHGHCAYCGCLLISIHASLREATCSRYQSSRKKQISIHASLREATVISTANVGASIFQFTPLYERLRKAFPRISQMILFQFTPLCERLRTGELII